MIDWIKCVFFKGGHRLGRWWWLDRQDGAGTHCLCEECGHLVTPSNRKAWASRDRAGQVANHEAA
jgi:hypothetical protein